MSRIFFLKTCNPAKPITEIDSENYMYAKPLKNGMQVGHYKNDGATKFCETEFVLDRPSSESIPHGLDIMICHTGLVKNLGDYDDTWTIEGIHSEDTIYVNHVPNFWTSSPIQSTNFVGNAEFLRQKKLYLMKCEMAGPAPMIVERLGKYVPSSNIRLIKK